MSVDRCGVFRVPLPRWSGRGRRRVFCSVRCRRVRAGERRREARAARYASWSGTLDAELAQGSTDTGSTL